MAECSGCSNGELAACVWWFFVTVQSTFPTDGDVGAGAGTVGSRSVRAPGHAGNRCELNSRHGSGRCGA